MRWIFFTGIAIHPTFVLVYAFFKVTVYFHYLETNLKCLSFQLVVLLPVSAEELNYLQFPSSALCCVTPLEQKHQKRLYFRCNFGFAY